MKRYEKKLSSAEKVVRALDRLEEAEAEHCTCTGFVIQYEGCGCGFKKKIDDRKFKMRRAVNKLRKMIRKNHEKIQKDQSQH